jgi:YebC/PmpR family DNA-binding regulatory protein
LFTRLIKELTVAAKLGGGAPDANPRLRSAVAAAKAANMPQDNIKRAIAKGTGELPGTTYDEVSYEGYGPGGVAVYIETLTDNRMRTTPEIRHLFTKHGGNLSEPNSVAWMFEKKGHFRVPREAVDEERLMEIVLEAGADDMVEDGEHFEVSTTVEGFHEVQQALEQAGVATSESAVVMEPTNTVELEGRKAEQCLRLLETLQDHEDVQNVYANLEVDDSALETGAA